MVSLDGWQPSGVLSIAFAVEDRSVILETEQGVFTYRIVKSEVVAADTPGVRA